MLSTRDFLSVIAMYSEELVLNILALFFVIYQTFFFMQFFCYFPQSNESVD